MFTPQGAGTRFIRALSLGLHLLGLTQPLFSTTVPLLFTPFTRTGFGAPCSRFGKLTT
jgi:hypothetical protein